MPAAAESTKLGTTWRMALGRSAATVWTPALVPVVTGMLHECSHCQTTYLLSLPLVPGMVVPVLLRLDDAWFVVGGAVATLVVFGVTALMLRELPRALGYVVQAIVALLIAFEAIGFANSLRM
jgi:hypothetical protein